ADQDDVDHDAEFRGAEDPVEQTDGGENQRPRTRAETVEENGEADDEGGGWTGDDSHWSGPQIGPGRRAFEKVRVDPGEGDHRRGERSRQRRSELQGRVVESPRQNDESGAGGPE